MFKSNSWTILLAILIMPVMLGAGYGEVNRTLEPVFTDFAALPFPMSALASPDFPDRVFNIVDFGAIEGKSAKNTAPINDAIGACSRLGGGTVLIPAGEWVTGPIHFKSNVNPAYLGRCQGFFQY